MSEVNESAIDLIRRWHVLTMRRDEDGSVYAYVEEQDLGDGDYHGRFGEASGDSIDDAIRNAVQVSCADVDDEDDQDDGRIDAFLSGFRVALGLPEAKP